MAKIWNPSGLLEIWCTSICNCFSFNVATGCEFHCNGWISFGFDTIWKWSAQSGNGKRFQGRTELFFLEFNWIHSSIFTTHIIEIFVQLQAYQHQRSNVNFCSTMFPLTSGMLFRKWCKRALSYHKFTDDHPSFVWNYTKNLWQRRVGKGVILVCMNPFEL